MRLCNPAWGVLPLTTCRMDRGATAFDKNRDFYAFYRSIEAYRNSLGAEGDLLVIGPDSDFLRFLKQSDGN